MLVLEWAEPEPVTEAELARNISLRLETAEEEGLMVYRVAEVTAALQDRAYFNRFLNLDLCAALKVLYSNFIHFEGCSKSMGSIDRTRDRGGRRSLHTNEDLGGGPLRCHLLRE